MDKLYTVVIVDDEATISEGLSRLVKWNDVGFNVIATFSNGRDASEFLKVNHADVILTDIKMPHMTGIELAKWIYENNINTKVVFLTGYKDFEYAKKAVEYNVNFYLLKPTQLSELYETFGKVKDILDKERTQTNKIDNIKHLMRDQFFTNLYFGAVNRNEDIEKMISALHGEFDFKANKYAVIKLEILQYDDYMKNISKYGAGVFNSYTHISDETDIRKRDWSYLLKDYTGKDTLQTMAEYGSENKFEVFWSMRMNDTHDHMYREDQLDSWKQANLDKLVSKKEEAFFMPYGNFRWSSIDYTYNESRQKVYDILKDVVSREEYNLSGIELDFTRFPIYFKEVTQGIDVYPENIERMNDLMRMIRALVDMYSVENGKPILLSIYVPDSIKYCKAIGLDIKTWLDEKLIDLVVVGETNRFQTWAESVAEYEPYNVPVYAAFDDLVFKTFKNNNDSITYKNQTVNDNKEKIVSYDIENEAAIAWNEGVDGIYIYNLWFNPAYADKKSFFYTLGDKEKVLNAHDTEYITFAKGADSISKGYVKNTADYATEALKNSITPNEAKRVIDGINNLPETSKLKVEDKASVESIETAYEALTDAQKLRVTNYQKLKDVRKKLDELLADLQ